MTRTERPCLSIELARLQADQDGVVSRRQAHDHGLSDADIRRMVRRRRWVPVHRGVYVDHTGPLTWRQRAWAACLAAWPAALSHESAVRAADGPGRRGSDDDGPVHVAVTRGRQALGLEGVVVHNVSALEDRVQWSASPPRVRIEEALLDLASTARDDFAAVAVIADAVRSRRTTATRLLSTLERRRRLGRRAFLRAVLVDVGEGCHSALERAYLDGVERPHGLPRSQRQAPDHLAPVGAPGRSVFHDVVYAAQGLVVELDGRVGHSTTSERDADLARDLGVKTSGRDTVRLGWGQVTRHACFTADQLARLLRLRGWTGDGRRCPDCPPTHR